MFFILGNFFLIAQVFALPSIPDCPYVFTHQVYYGQSDEEVKIIQEILNSDSRTYVAVEGIGSPGLETTLFGRATREALKRFQALFIEYIGDADGKFNSATMSVMQKVCNGENVYEQSEIPPPTETQTNPTEITGPTISISTSEKEVTPGQPFKIILNSDKDIQEISDAGIIAEGAVVQSKRKLSKTSFAIFFVVNDDAKEVSVQIEAEGVTSIDGGNNEEASNEIYLKVITPAEQISSEATDSFSDKLNSILQSLMAGFGSATTSTQVNCFGNMIPASQPCTDPRQNQNPLSQMLSDPNLMRMLQGFGSGLGGSPGGQPGANQQGGNQSNNGGNNSGNPGGNQGNTTPPEDGELKKLKDAMDKACEKDKNSDECKKATEAYEKAQKEAEEALKKCGGSGTDEEIRSALKKIGVNITSTGNCSDPGNKSCTSLGKINRGIPLFFKHIKDKCPSCGITVSGGSETGHDAGASPYGSHGAGRALDMGINNGAFNNFIETNGKCQSLSSGPMSRVCEYKGVKFYDESRAGTPRHWHVDISGLKCDKDLIN